MSDETWRYESNARETLHAIYHILNRMRSTLDDISLQTRTVDELNESIQAVNYQTNVLYPLHARHRFARTVPHVKRSEPAA
jgi:hypothetical protein